MKRRKRQRCQHAPSGDNGSGVGDKQMQKLAFVDGLCSIVSGFVVQLNFINSENRGCAEILSWHCVRMIWVKKEKERKLK